MVFMEFYAPIHNNIKMMPGNDDIIPEWATVPSEFAQELVLEERSLGPRGRLTDGQWNATIDWCDEDISSDEYSDEELSELELTEEEDEESSSDEEDGAPPPSDEESSSDEEESGEESGEESEEEPEEGEIRDWGPIDLENIDWLPMAEDISYHSITIN